MNAHGWGNQADSVCEAAVPTIIDSISLPGLFTIADCYKQSGKYERAMHLYKQMEKVIETGHEDEEDSLKHLTDLTAALNSPGLKQQPEYQSLLSTVSKELVFRREQIRRRQCLSMADQLNKTAFDLERNAHSAMALKLYQQALEIKQLNLSANDPETALQMLDVARTASEAKEYQRAQSLYEKALAIFRGNSRTDPADTLTALESYGQLLERMKQQDKAKKVYDEARDLSREMHR